MSQGRCFEAPELIEVMDEAVRYNRFLSDQLRDWSEGFERILDFGAGNGRFALRLSEASSRTVEVVEPDPELRRGIEAKGLTGHESLAALPEQSFDALYTINVLEHLGDDRSCLRGFFDVLRPGGALFVYVPAFPLLFSSNDVRVGHVRRYRMEGLLSKVREAGFAIETVRYVDSLGFLAGLSYRLFGDRDGDLAPGAVRAYDRFLFPVSRVLDRPLGRLVGKNLLLRALRPATPREGA